jgi:hypothetical protein
LTVESIADALGLLFDWLGAEPRAAQDAPEPEHDTDVDASPPDDDDYIDAEGEHVP